MYYNKNDNDRRCIVFVGKNIKYLRTHNNMTLEDMSKLLGYKSLTTIQKWEADIAQPPLKKVQQIADYFKVDIDDLTNKDLQYNKKDTSSFQVSSLEKQVITNYRKADDRDKGLVNHILGIETSVDDISENIGNKKLA